MIIRSKAPLRLGLAGGGTDVSPYSDLYGGAILNSTINLYVYTTITPTDNGLIKLNALDLGTSVTLPSSSALEIVPDLALPIGVYNRIIKDYGLDPLSFELTTYVEVPKGSGLGTSSTIVVGILGAFAEWLKLPLGEYDLARLAYQIEREDLAMAGGKQDQYAATFGGVNYMEFSTNDSVIVNPLRVKPDYMSELEHNLLLYYTGTARQSASIIDKQSKAFKQKGSGSVEAAHALKAHAVDMKKALLTGKVDDIGIILNESWQHKKRMAEGISNPHIDAMYDVAMQAGALGGKISGAGGGGYMFFYCPANNRYPVMEAMQQFGAQLQPFSFVRDGLISWKVR